MKVTRYHIEDLECNSIRNLMKDSNKIFEKISEFLCSKNYAYDIKETDPITNEKIRTVSYNLKSLLITFFLD